MQDCEGELINSLMNGLQNYVSPNELQEVQLIAGHTDISTTAMYNRSDMALVESEFRRRG